MSSTDANNPNRSPIRVLLVEDSHFTRLGIATLLRTEPEIEVVAEAANGNEALALFNEKRPDVVLTDIRMPDSDGIDLTRKLTALDPKGRVLVLSDYDGEEVVFQALRAGAQGYLTKGVSGTELLTALRAVASGLRYFPPSISARLADRILQPNLTPREMQVLNGFLHGKTNQEIADDLSISKRTATMFVSKILFKLGARTRAEAVSIAIQRGLIEAGRP
jgi:two-component system, NarL family, response regulator